MKKIKTIQLSSESAQAIAIALKVYADAAYPPGGSECAQASNQTLKDLAIKIYNSPTDPFNIKSRQKPMIKAAVRWYYGEDNPLQIENREDPERLISELEGKS